MIAFITIFLSATTRVENPRGELGYFIISDGALNPARVKVRAPSFVTMQVFPELCKGFGHKMIIAAWIHCKRQSIRLR
ncbi:MAG: hypothetical protein ACFFB7_09040 [Candidatus Sifarchaeia archaeon]